MSEQTIDWMPTLTATEWALILATLEYVHKEFLIFGETRPRDLLEKLKSSYTDHMANR